MNGMLVDDIVQTKEELIALFLNAEKLFIEVDDLVWKDDIQYIDSLMLICDEKGINPEDLVRLDLISPKLKMFLQEEAEENGILKRESRLPIE
jgi:hypothetical protein